ncbi:glycosyl hydrolase 115 family protein [Fulvivirga ligni]|uniref:glycosyl hydrolase 115 family protein n=1 Tax=Fulvivirga ligni TaxID=2904246 RepID=UPI001F2B5423|nr:glycosyl hydrolase 115 family protein [Fulvivirga ligni]UII23320.1 glycosyl hydrolase 115 family protein [Fulvivirga ligni]
MKRFLITYLLICLCISLKAQKNFDPEENYVSYNAVAGSFPLVAKNKATSFYLSPGEFEGVQEIAGWLQSDIQRVTNIKPEIFIDKKAPKSEQLVIIGTLGRNPLIDKLVKNGQLDVSGIDGKWEHFLIQKIKKPFKGVDEALIIAGSDKRGTIYGMMDLSEKIGVSPWYWWADVPVIHQQNIYITKNFTDAPKVKYRGIFINDEAPALSGWVQENFGDFNHEFYNHVFELILRMKGNYLWPAMWGRAIYDDDSLSARLANKLGVVIGTSHHEPLMRAHVEWSRYGKGPWDYSKNKQILQEFWREGMERMENNESIVTIAMRGDGDEPMSEDSNIQLLENIVKDQREIIEEVTGKPAKETPQLWALYKEVQDYYDKGMRVPDDVTLLLCDDNWGNIRKLPALSDSLRSGGYGIYYHFDYVGGPRNYKWLNTNQISRTWEQMNLAYNYNADKIWIVNVGDIKPMEYPISFFMDYAWDPTLSADKLPDYTINWTASQFGKEHEKAISDILEKYTKYNSRRKPELLSPETYNITNGEFETIVNEYQQLVEKTDSIQQLLSEPYQAAYFQLVSYPVKASANINELYYAAALNNLYAQQGRSATDSLANRVEELFNKDQKLADEYHQLLNGKWNHMMDQTHIGYTSWQEPRKNIIPNTQSVTLKQEAEMGIAIEGKKETYSQGSLALPAFSSINPLNKWYLDIFNLGNKPFQYTISTEQPWINISSSEGKIQHQQRIWISINWDQLKKSGSNNGSITISGTDQQVVVNIEALKIDVPTGVAYVEENGVISIEPKDYTKAINTEGISWTEIPNLGRTSSAVSAMPVTKTVEKPGQNSPHLEYDIYLLDKGELNVTAYLSPTLPYHNKGLRLAISIDDQAPQILNMHQGENGYTWGQSVSNNIRTVSTKLMVEKSGKHTLKYWLVDPGVVLQKLSMTRSESSETNYLGPTVTKNLK